MFNKYFNDISLKTYNNCLVRIVHKISRYDVSGKLVESVFMQFVGISFRNILKIIKYLKCLHHGIRILCVSHSLDSFSHVFEIFQKFS